MKSRANSAFNHPDFGFAVDHLYDALYEECVEKPANSRRFFVAAFIVRMRVQIFKGLDRAYRTCYRIAAGKNESDDSRGLID
jgi:hypothetical protein